MLKAWRDPFGNGNRRITELEESIKIIKMQVELLRDSLEQEKLKEELAKMKKGFSPAPVFTSKPVSNTQVKSQDKITVKAILISDVKKSALLYMANKKAWVKVGDLFEGWLISEINSDRVVLTRDGRDLVLGYHPVPSFEGGRNE
jgi:type II secretory pathway component PulC